MLMDKQKASVAASSISNVRTVTVPWITVHCCNFAINRSCHKAHSSRVLIQNKRRLFANPLTEVSFVDLHYLHCSSQLVMAREVSAVIALLHADLVGCLHLVMPPTQGWTKKVVSKDDWEKKLAAVKVYKEDMNKLVMDFLVTEVWSQQIRSHGRFVQP